MFKSNRVKEIAAAIVVIASASAASAAPTVFTFSPAAAGLTGASLTGDNITVKDYATVSLGATTGSNTAFTEDGFLQFDTVGTGSTIANGGLNSTFSLYIAFSASGTQTSASFNTSSLGTFDRLDYTLYGENGVAAFSVSGGTPAVTDASAPVTIATGSLISGATTFSAFGGNFAPGATVEETVNKTIPAFFVSPANLSLSLFGSFTNAANQVTITNGGTAFTLNAGGGVITFNTVAAPEPLSLALVGTGLLGLGIIRRRR